MADDRANRSEGGDASESLISMRNAGLVMLPWLMYQQRVLKEAKNVIDDEDHPVRDLIRRLGTTAYGSQLGLQMALRKSGRGEVLLMLSEMLTKAQDEFARKVQESGETFQEPARKIVESYEDFLDATIDEVRKQTGKGGHSAGGKRGSKAQTSRKPTTRRKPRTTRKTD